LAGLARTWQDLAGLGRTWKDLAGLNRTWQDLVGLGRTWQDLAGLGMTWQDLAGLRRTWQDLAGLGSVIPQYLVTLLFVVKENAESAAVNIFRILSDAFVYMYSTWIMYIAYIT
jgi:hypothetical protein